MNCEQFLSLRQEEVYSLAFSTIQFNPLWGHPSVFGFVVSTLQDLSINFRHPLFVGFLFTLVSETRSS